MALLNRNVLRPGSPVANLIIQCLSQNTSILFFNFIYPVRCFSVLPGICVPQVEGYCSNQLKMSIQTFPTVSQADRLDPTRLDPIRPHTLNY
jgi:hypothetical protein